MKDSLAVIAPTEMALGRPTATARRLVNASVSDNTRRAYAGALGQLDAWLDGRRLDDAALATYLAELHDAGRAASSAATAVAAARFRAKLAGGRVPPARLLPESSPATAELPPTAAAARLARLAPPTWRPCSPPATGRGAAAGASSPTRSPPRAAVWTP